MTPPPSTNVAEAFDQMDYGTAPESDKEARAWLASHQGQLPLYINGSFEKPAKAATFDTVNPYNKERLTSVTQGSAEDIDKAVSAARAAQKDWAALKGFERAKYLYAIARLINKHSRLFAVLESMDNGKPIRESRDADIPLVIRHFYHHAGWAQIAEKDYPDYEAYGVVGQVIPWNFPLLMLAWKVAPALALGNTVVLKPAEQTPLTALLFAQICEEAGLPNGVVNIVTGDGTTGAMLTTHPDINKVAFTGSTDVGRIIREATAGSGKALTLELGGKSPYIVFDDADMDSAVEGLVDAIWFNQGEVCCGGSRLLVQESIFDRFIAKVVARMNKLRLGDPLDKSIDVGCVVDEVQRERITRLVDKAVENGAKPYQVNMNTLVDNCPKDACFYPPTLLTDIEPSDDIAQTEIFGPVLCALTFKNQEEALSIANNTRYGLAATIWSENINMALELAPRLKTGIVWINGSNMFDAAAGFGGYRESGYGREGGREGLFAYMKPKYEAQLKAGKTITATANAPKESRANGSNTAAAIDATPKNYVGGKQARPDSGYSLPVYDTKGLLAGHVGDGNRKDIRNAVEAAAKACGGWAKTNVHSRAQILYYLAENLSQRKNEFTNLLNTLTGESKVKCEEEFTETIARIFAYAGWCDKFEGHIHTPPMKAVALAMNEPLGVIGLVCPETQPLLSMISLMMPAVAMGNSVIVIPSQNAPLVATLLMQVLETSDIPAGVINIVTGLHSNIVPTLAQHDGVDSLWYFGDSGMSTDIEKWSIGNLKQTWVNYGKNRNWLDDIQSEGENFLRRATQVKNIWVPYGETF